MKMKKGALKVQERHGGDVYRHSVELDFSVNINPLGVPQAVREALRNAVEHCDKYPDLETEALKHMVSREHGISESNLLFGNGASEMFMSIFHAIRPKTVLLPIPSFFGYEHAANAVGSVLRYLPLRQETGFQLEEQFFDALTEDIDVLVLANPNNPTGVGITRELLCRILDVCEEQQITVILDECFIEFCDHVQSMLPWLEQYPNLIIVRAFTKIYSIPGVRLGYLATANQERLSAIRSQLPEWNVSVFAQYAGIACAQQKHFIKKTVEYVTGERNYLLEGLEKLGCFVVSGQANFILFFSPVPLYPCLLERGILIRDCENFRGLSKGYYRIAVKTRKENEILLKVIGEELERHRICTSTGD